MMIPKWTSTIRIAVIAGGLLMALAVSPAAAAGPTTAPALPAGHPDISGMSGAAGTRLPTGHPDISSMMAPDAVESAATALPPGHPDISGRAPASTRPSALGTLTIHVTQGTRDGPPIAGDNVVVELYHNNQAMDRLDTRLDEQGNAVLRDVQVSYGVRPVVIVTHDGLEYQTPGQLMDANHPNLAIDLTVYEATEQAPAWQFRARHLMISPDEHGLRVTEMLVVENPTDRTWRGAADTSGQRSTFALPISAGAQDLQLGASLGAASLVDGKLVNHDPLTPGTSQYQFSYVLPVEDGKSQLVIGTSAPLAHLMVFLPDDGSTVKADGLEALGVSKTEQGGMRYYKAGPLSAGQQVTMNFDGVRLIAPDAGQTSAAAPAVATSMLPKVVAGVGGVIVVLFGAAFMFIKAPKPAKKRN